MKLRPKILSGFFILTLMLLLAGVWSIYELRSIGSSVQQLLNDNYKSINAGKHMVEALEREDSGILLLILGHWQEGRRILTSGDSLFRRNFDVARNNLTIEGEQAYLDSIQIQYNRYQNSWEKPIVGTSKQGNITWYLEETHQAFVQTKQRIEALISLNDKVMFQTATSLKDKANRAVMPGIVAIIAALVFTFVFNYFVNYYMVNPIVRITRGIQNFVNRRLPFDIDIETRDEFSDLTTSIKTLCALTQPPETEE